MSKITAEHLQRNACVYIRQSTPDQIEGPPAPRNGPPRPGGLPASFLPRGAGSSPSRWAFLRASLRARRSASLCSRADRSDGFYLLRFISRNTPSRCIFFLRTRSAWSTLLSRTMTCKEHSLHTFV